MITFSSVYIPNYVLDFIFSFPYSFVCWTSYLVILAVFAPILTLTYFIIILQAFLSHCVSALFIYGYLNT